MEKIIFEPLNHKYWRESDGVQLMSASHFYKQFGDFDTEAGLSRKAVQKIFGPTRYTKIKKAWNAQGRHIYEPEYITHLESLVPNWETYLELREQFRAEWGDKGTKGAGKGTDIHAAKEAADMESGFAVHSLTGEVYEVRKHGKESDGSNRSTVESLADLPDGFYGELLLWWFFPRSFYCESMGTEICGICGQIDRGFKRKNRMSIEDWKSNKDLSTYSIKIPNYGLQYHLPPFHHMPKSDVSKYWIQLNTYAWICNRHGLIVDDARLLHVPEGEVLKEVPIQLQPHLIDLAVSNLLNSAL